MLMTWASFNNIRLLMMACIPVVIFYLIWLINSSESIRSEEGTLLDLVCWPDGNAIPVVITCSSIVTVVVELYGLYQLFKAGLPRQEYNVTNGLYYYTWALIIMIIIFLAIMFYSGLQSTIIRAKIKGGISKAMLRYSSHLPSKVAIDRLQTRFHCCGRVSYQEWFYIPWYKQSEQPLVAEQAPHKFFADNVPYSCCSRDAMTPCIHHGVTQPGTFYKYDPKHLTIWQAGCEEKLINEMMHVSWKFNGVASLILVAMVIQAITMRYLHTAYKNGLHKGNQIICEAYLLRSMTDTAALEIAYRPITRRRKVFRRRKNKQSRTMQWVRAVRTPPKNYPMSSSDFTSSDEQLKPIYEQS